MFKVKFKYDKNSKAEIVYSVRKADDGTTEFLVFRFGRWNWYDANFYEPCEEEA